MVHVLAPTMDLSFFGVLLAVSNFVPLAGLPIWHAVGLRFEPGLLDTIVRVNVWPLSEKPCAGYFAIKGTKCFMGLPVITWLCFRSLEGFI